MKNKKYLNISIIYNNAKDEITYGNNANNTNHYINKIKELNIKVNFDDFLQVMYL